MHQSEGHEAMSEEREMYKACGVLAPLFRYPTAELVAQVRASEAALRERWPETARCLREFLAFLEVQPPARWEEVYTSTFDLQPVCWPYVGYQLFGESYKRGMFMASLRGTYRQCGFEPGDDLPDHLAVVLTFLGHCWHRDPDVARDLVEVCLKPALAKMVQAAQKARTPYAALLEALTKVVGVPAQQDVQGFPVMTDRVNLGAPPHMPRCNGPFTF